eukprot:4771277-Prorocentrum_lima.AAC.1
MTSSLVGSEMCIRDRGNAVVGERTNSKDKPHNPKPSTALCRLFNKNGTVSYTHLTLPTICSV